MFSFKLFLENFHQGIINQLDSFIKAQAPPGIIADYLDDNNFDTLANQMRNITMQEWIKIYNGKHGDINRFCVATNPVGEEFITTNLKQFCNKNNLSYSNMHGITKGKSTSYEGWHCREATMTMQEWQKLRDKVRPKKDKPNIKNWIVIDPNGVEYHIKGLYRFSKENNLPYTCMKAVASGRCKKGNYKGWKVRYDTSIIK